MFPVVVLTSTHTPTHTHTTTHNPQKHTHTTHTPKRTYTLLNEQYSSIFLLFDTWTYIQNLPRAITIEISQ